MIYGVATSFTTGGLGIVPDMTLVDGKGWRMQQLAKFSIKLIYRPANMQNVGSYKKVAQKTMYGWCS